ncbi:MAG: hypothetical protein MJ237_03250 [bacterium]|nr:hypothetical protein [bacterium]
MSNELNIGSIKNAALRAFAESIDINANNGGQKKGVLEESELSIFMQCGSMSLKENKSAYSEFKEICDKLMKPLKNRFLYDGGNILKAPKAIQNTENSNVEAFAEQGYFFKSTKELEDGTQLIIYENKDGSELTENLTNLELRYYDKEGHLTERHYKDYTNNNYIIDKIRGNKNSSTIATYTADGVLICETTAKNSTVTTKYYDEETGKITKSSISNGNNIKEGKIYKHVGDKKYIEQISKDNGNYHIFFDRDANGNLKKIKFYQDTQDYQQNFFIDVEENAVTGNWYGYGDDVQRPYDENGDFNENKNMSICKNFIYQCKDIPQDIKEKIRSGKMEVYCEYRYESECY